MLSWRFDHRVQGWIVAQLFGSWGSVEELREFSTGMATRCRQAGQSGCVLDLRGVYRKPTPYEAEDLARGIAAAWTTEDLPAHIAGVAPPGFWGRDGVVEAALSGHGVDTRWFTQTGAADRWLGGMERGPHSKEKAA